MVFIGISFQKIASTSSSPFLAEKYMVYYHLQNFQYQYHYEQKNKSAKNMLNGSGPKIKLCGTPYITASHSLHELLTLILCFHVTVNHELILKLED